MGQEKRRHPRFVVEGVGGRIGLRARVELIDVGAGGAAIRSKRKLNVGDEYALTFDLAGQAVTIRGVVAWAAGADEATRLSSAGVRFTETPPPKLLRALTGAIGPRHVAAERRAAGIRLQFQAPGKAVLESTEVYAVKLISLSGLLIETAGRLESGGVYEMEMQPPGHEPFAFTGGVRSCLETAGALPPRYEIGIEFVGMSSEATERLNRFVGWLATRD